MYKKSNSFVSRQLSVFSKELRQDMPYKAENWHGLSHEQCYSTHRFLDICRSAFKAYCDKCRG